MREEICIPNPEYLIKSIAEQGYTLETSIADLLDNSISAGATKIEVLVDTQKSPYQLFIADNGSGMSQTELQSNIRFPSDSPDSERSPSDLGRFGLGLKTASFAQTRCFTVISKKPEDKKYNARTWDVEHLKRTGRWEVIVNTDDEINKHLMNYRRLSKEFLNGFDSYLPNTVIVWNGLYKFENERNTDRETLQRELSETTKEHLQLTFHRFMERAESPLQIRVNNEQLIPFNPFPQSARRIGTAQKSLANNTLHLEGFVLPSKSIEESKGLSEWTLSSRSLMDMEGMYVYRADRLIVFGGWNGVIKKSPRLQLARLKVEVSNGIDHLFHLNVAKSSIHIPFGERIGFIRYVSELKTEAEKEYFNIASRAQALKPVTRTIFKKVPTSHGMMLQPDEEFPLLKTFISSLNGEQQLQLRIIMRMITTTINKIKKVHKDDLYNTISEKQDFDSTGITQAIHTLIKDGVSKDNILNYIIPEMGISTESLPESILKLLK